MQHLGRAFPILYQHIGDIAQNFSQRLFQRNGVFALDCNPGSAVGQAINGIIGAGVAVNADPVEGQIYSPAEHSPPEFGSNSGIAQDHS